MSSTEVRRALGLAKRSYSRALLLIIFITVGLLGSAFPAAAQQITFNTAKSFPVGGSITDVASGDFDSDGKQDIVAATGTSLLLLRGLGNGRVAPPVIIPLGSYPNTNPAAIAVGDLNRDGKLDLTVGNYGAVSVISATAMEPLLRRKAIPSIVAM